MITLKRSTDKKAWNRFLEKEKEDQMITIAHNPSLGPILSKTFGYISHNMLLMKDQDIVGVIPAVLFLNKIISIPHFSYGGLIKDSNFTLDIDLNSLFENRKFEIRSFTRWSNYYYDKKISCVLKLHSSIDDQWMSVKSKLRQKIRKTEKLNFRIKNGGLELLDDFYTLYSSKMLEFGSPPLGKIFFRNLLTDYEFGEAQISAIYDNDKVVAVGMSLSYLNFNELCWSCAATIYNNHNVYSLLWWEMIKNSVAKKHTYFSFGRSTIDSNNHTFKKQWNPIELPIFYNYSEERTKSIREFEILTKIWKLQPLKTSVYFGQFISKHIY